TGDVHAEFDTWYTPACAKGHEPGKVREPIPGVDYINANVVDEIQRAAEIKRGRKPDGEERQTNAEKQKKDRDKKNGKLTKKQKTYRAKRAASRSCSMMERRDVDDRSQRRGAAEARAVRPARDRVGGRAPARR